MAAPANTFAIDVEAAMEAGRRWHARRAHHRKIERGKGPPSYSKFESADRILLRAKRLQSHPAIAERSASAAMLVESFSPSPGASLGQPPPPVNEVMLERVLNRTRDFQFTAFLEQAIYVANAVCRISTEVGQGRISYGTGFLVTPRLLLTNHHVLPDIAAAQSSTAEFGFQQDRWGNVAAPRRYSLDPATLFLNDKLLDFALVAVDCSRRDRDSPWVWCPMIKDLGKIITLEHVNIIQHPRGEVKQVVIRENRLLDSFDGKEHVLHYEADTEPGSSGCPVFNDQWEVVALHHSGVPRTDEQGRMLRKNGRLWRRGIDPDDIEWVANEGIRTSKIVGAVEQFHLQGEARDLQQEFLAAIPPDTKSHGFQPAVTDRAVRQPTAAAADAARPSGAAVSSAVSRLAPSSPVPSGSSTTDPIDSTSGRMMTMNEEQRVESGNSLRMTIPIQIAITVRVPGNGDPVMAVSSATASAMTHGQLAASRGDASTLLEKITPAPDYDNRPGYDPEFLGFGVPFPKLTVKTRSQAFVVPGATGDGKYLLNYYHYSLIFNRERKLAFVSGVNFDPTAKVQHPRDTGGDKWFFDPRVVPEEELQAGEDLYAANALDRGHLVRRADAAWGATAKEAKLANDDTFHFTNCSPQHEVTNQGKQKRAPRGLRLWGKLEEYVAKQGKDAAQRLSIFNGPVFRDNDRVYRGVKLPKQFWKVIVFAGPSGKPAAAAFKLTQATLIQGLEEAFEFDEYRTVQLSIKELEADTGLNFGKIAAWDSLDDETAHESFAPGTGVVILDELDDIILGP